MQVKNALLTLFGFVLTLAVLATLGLMGRLVWEALSWGWRLL